MEGQQISLVVTPNAPAPLSDSESSIHQYPVKYATINNDASCLKPCVVDQWNGRWGACLCANGEHIWLVSFETKEEAALVIQKSASIEFCDVDSNTQQFQSHSTTDEVISMTMDSSYGTMFPNFWRAQVQEKSDSPALRDTLGFNLRQLFMKVLTPLSISLESLKMKASRRCHVFGHVHEVVEVSVLLLEKQPRLRFHQRLEWLFERKVFEAKGHGYFLGLCAQ